MMHSVLFPVASKAVASKPGVRLDHDPGIDAMLTSPPPACAGGGAVTAAVTAALQFFAVTQCLVREPWPPQAELQNGARFDFIVVGGGTAGPVVASRLAEVEGVSVLLIEAGGDPPQESVIPGFRDLLKGSQYDWNFTTIDDGFSSQALKDGSQSQPRGKVLGGSGSINDMIYSRGFPADYHEWASILGDDWSWESVLDYFKKTERLTDEKIINDPELMAYHSRHGEMEVTGRNQSTHATDRFLDAFKEMGFDIVRDMTNPTKLGAGRFSHCISKGQRESSVTALLNKAKGNIFVLKNTLATKILIDDEKKAYGVNVISNNKHLAFYADREVIVSAGTFNTPKLLMLSGIGPAQHLEELGIPVVHNLPVGENLHDHIMVLTYLAVESGTCSSKKHDDQMEMIKYLHDRTGALSKTNTMGAYLTMNGSTDPTTPDFAIYPICVPKGVQFYEGCSDIVGFKDSICLKLANLNKHHELLNIAVVLLKPKSRGKVRLSSTNPLDDPLIYSGTFSNDEDLKGFPEALKVANKIGDSRYFRKKGAFPVEFNLEECKGTMGSEALACRARVMATSAWHAVGTAAMGSVLDSRLRVKGVAGLRVVDASVMPEVTRGNTFAPVVMIAEKAADFIKKDHDINEQASQFEVIELI